MPNRIIKESICTSENIDQLTEFQEIFFYRLMVNCDDFGRFDARPKLLSSRLFPLRDISSDTIIETLDALQDADLIIVYAVNGHPYLQMKTWDKHQQARATKSKYPSPDEGRVEESDNQLQSNDINCNQSQSDDDKCPRIRNRIRNTISDNRNRNARAREDDNDLHQIQQEHDIILDAAERAGFPKSESVRDQLIAFYAEHGKEKLLEAITACVEHSAPTIAYLRAVLRGDPKPAAKPAKSVPAQQYHQRQCATDQTDAIRQFVAMADREGFGNAG